MNLIETVLPRFFWRHLKKLGGNLNLGGSADHQLVLTFDWSRVGSGSNLLILLVGALAGYKSSSLAAVSHPNLLTQDLSKLLEKKSSICPLRLLPKVERKPHQAERRSQPLTRRRGESLAVSPMPSTSTRC